ncbi:MAG: YdeI/OmpD-associated family protein [Bacteroidia bacterium]|nr:YdeI/OmpD-associated family protein [Bacteroidia bacterium]
MEAQPVAFTAVLEMYPMNYGDRNPVLWVFARLPFRPQEQWGVGGAMVHVLATVDGIAHKGLAVALGGGVYALGTNQALRDRLGKGVGDSVTITLAPNPNPQALELPPLLADLLGALPDLAATFETLTLTQRKEIARLIGEAKRPETAEQWLVATVELLEAWPATQNGTLAPPDLAHAIGQVPDAQRYFAQMVPSHRREIVFKVLFGPPSKRTQRVARMTEHLALRWHQTQTNR